MAFTQEESGRAGDEPEMSLGEIVDRASRRITAALVIAGALIGGAIYSRPSPPRFTAVAGVGQVVRLNTRSGDMLACGPKGCASIYRSSHHHEFGFGGKPAVPAPQAQLNQSGG